MTCGVNNPEKGDGAEPQDEDVMVALMQTESWKARNVLKARNSAFDGSGSGFGKNNIVVGKVSNASVNQSHPGTPLVAPNASRESSYGKPSTKKEHLKRVGEDIFEMLSEFKGIKEDRGVDPETKQLALEGKVSLSNARREESEAGRNFHTKQYTLAEITLLKEQ